MTAHEQFADDLALYALGSLEGGEKAAIERHVEECAACRRELEALRGDLSLLALTTAGPKPPARARQRLLSAIAREPHLPATIVEPARVRRSSWESWWGLVGWAAAAAMLLLAIGLFRQNSSLQRDLAAVNAQFADQGAKLHEARAIVAALVDPDTKKVELVAAGNKPQPRGKAMYQHRTRSLIFFASNLPQLPPEKIYELWLFPASGGAPIAAGLFRPDAQGGAMVVNPPLPGNVEAKNFVVTMEPESGSHEAPRGTAVISGVGL